MIFAAGLGTRLKPITDTMPKAMVPVGGTPLIGHVIRRLQGCGFDDFVVNVHHFPDQIIDYLEANDHFGSSIAVSNEQPEPLETGGGIWAARELLMDGAEPDDSFLVHNVDIISDLDIPWFIEQARPDALATLLVSSRQTQRYFLFNDEMRLVGWTNLATGEVRSPYHDLDVAACHKYAFAGIHLISNRIFEEMKKEKREGRFSIVDFYLSVAAREPIYGVVPPELHLIDVGKLDTLARAEEFIAQEVQPRQNCPEA